MQLYVVGVILILCVATHCIPSVLDLEELAQKSCYRTSSEVHE